MTLLIAIFKTNHKSFNTKTALMIMHSDIAMPSTKIKVKASLPIIVKLPSIGDHPS